MWPPNFRLVDTVEEAADVTNRPHEDYPRRVDRTAQLIAERNDCGCHVFIPVNFVLYLHEQVMWDLEPVKDRGAWRSCDVRVGPEIKMRKECVPACMSALLPYTAQDRQKLEDFYVLFNEIHPFRDGNGRVSGIIIAVMGKSLWLPGYLVSGV